MKLLLVDDELGALNTLIRAVGEACPNDEIFSFQDPTKALEFAHTTIFDVAFLDISMRGMNGVVLAKNLKDIMPGMGIIFCTAYSEYAVEAIKLRVSGYLMKPVVADDVRDEMRSLENPRYIPYKRPLVVRTFGNFEVFYEGKPG